MFKGSSALDLSFWRMKNVFSSKMKEVSKHVKKPANQSWNQFAIGFPIAKDSVKNRKQTVSCPQVLRFVHAELRYLGSSSRDVSENQNLVSRMMSHRWLWNNWAAKYLRLVNVKNKSLRSPIQNLVQRPSSIWLDFTTIFILSIEPPCLQVVWRWISFILFFCNNNISLFGICFCCLKFQDYILKSFWSSSSWSRHILEVGCPSFSAKPS